MVGHQHLSKGRREGTQPSTKMSQMATQPQIVDIRIMRNSIWLEKSVTRDRKSPKWILTWDWVVVLPAQQVKQLSPILQNHPTTALPAQQAALGLT